MGENAIYVLGGLLGLCSAFLVFYKVWTIFKAGRNGDIDAKVNEHIAPLNNSLERLEETITGFGNSIGERFDHHEELMKSQHQAIETRLNLVERTAHKANDGVIRLEERVEGMRRQ